MSGYKPIGYALAFYAYDATTKYLWLLGPGKFEWVPYVTTNACAPPVTLFRSAASALSYAEKHFPIFSSYMDAEPVYDLIGRGSTKSYVPDYQFYEEDSQ